MNKRICCLLCFLLVASFSMSGCGDKQSSTTPTIDSTNIVGKWELISEKADDYEMGYWFKDDGSVIQYTVSQKSPVTIGYTYKESSDGYEMYSPNNDSPSGIYYIETGILYGDIIGANGEKMGLVNEYKKVDDFSFSSYFK